ncbi:3-ketoacyl-ACP reductase [Paenibacillus baekrokdamisoli]|uniref:3-ketoacyl-ACP reductase n=1 Tax=Paenibacillus baekrokdamisoli TaxID=1712516 RepID=A0A3G9ITV4_9BACL|nr:SDR family oxidoreductase [Paenibacillus baekrokdamisoli]MBB3071255.1 3-oxoacyl-[acyl-carrier protein] reductase [Paenibacillus baekrokdamisoli]BBH21672.1 3-ketoacyl-ACP reductase [Paenibacillus baekrokdamisoli]
MELQGKTALITGSAKGLGKMSALALARMGCDIVINYVTSEQAANKLVEEIQQQSGVRATAICADIAKRDHVDRLAAEAQAWSHNGTIDILINNAGPFIRERRLFTDYDVEDIITLLHGNLLGVMLLDHKLLPQMREHQWGRIIHFGFGHAGEGRAWPQRAVYASAKTGLVSFTKTLAVEEAGNGITVHMVCPGDIRGDNKERSIAEVKDERDDESPRSRPGSGEDIARVITFLCLPQSDYLTGNIVDVTGGFDPIKTSIMPT